MLVIIKRPFEGLQRTEIGNTLEALQSAVGGDIEHISFDLLTNECPGKVGLLLDEDGKTKGKEPNFFLVNDIVVGTAVFVGESGEEFIDLSDEQADFIENLFRENLFR